MVDVDQFGRDRWRLRQDTEPAERIGALEDLQRGWRHALAAHAMEAIAAGDEVARDLVADAVLGVAHARAVAVEVVQAHVVGLEDDLETGLVARVHEIARDFGLAVDGDGLAAGCGFHIDTVARSAERHFHAVVDETLAMQPLRRADLFEQADRALFQHARPDTREHVVTVLALQDDGLDSVEVQQLAQQQAGWSCTDDGNLCPHLAAPQAQPPACGRTLPVMKPAPSEHRKQIEAPNSCDLPSRPSGIWDVILAMASLLASRAGGK